MSTVFATGSISVNCGATIIATPVSLEISSAIFASSMARLPVASMYVLKFTTRRKPFGNFVSLASGARGLLRVGVGSLIELLLCDNHLQCAINFFTVEDYFSECIRHFQRVCVLPNVS